MLKGGGNEFFGSRRAYKEWCAQAYLGRRGSNDNHDRGDYRLHCRKEVGYLEIDRVRLKLE